MFSQVSFLVIKVAYTIHPPIDGLLPQTDIDLTSFRNSVFKIVGLRCMPLHQARLKNTKASFSSKTFLPFMFPASNIYVMKALETWET